MEEQLYKTNCVSTGLTILCALLVQIPCNPSYGSATVSQATVSLCTCHLVHLYNDLGSSDCCHNVLERVDVSHHHYRWALGKHTLYSLVLQHQTKPVSNHSAMMYCITHADTLQTCITATLWSTSARPCIQQTEDANSSGTESIASSSVGALLHTWPKSSPFSTGMMVSGA